MPKPLRRILLLIVLTLVYVLAFPRSTGTEPLIERQWVLSLDGAAADGAVAGDGRESRVIPFRLGSQFGYFTSDGSLRHIEQMRYGIAQDRERFANYSVISDNVVLQDPDGAFVRSIAAHGYPRLDDGRLHIFAPGGSAVSEWTVDGQQVWARDFLSVLTDLDAGETRTAVGLLDGSVHLLGEEGEELFSYATEGARIPVTLAVALGNDEDVIAAVAGIDPQKLILFERHTEGFFPVFQLELDSDYRRPVLLDFLDDGATLAVEQPGGLLLYDRSTESFDRIDLGGEIDEVTALPELDLVLAAARVAPGTHGAGATRGEDGSPASVRRLQATVWPDLPLFSQAMATDDVFLSAAGSRIYIGANGRLLCVELVQG
ncbi:MAG: hypothetical protein GVY14_02980 [Spirochaetes bacterium]|jgi:hypothetical protein|nr:hypothetical protein [Spirochaetota bacterium]